MAATLGALGAAQGMHNHGATGATGATTAGGTQYAPAGHEGHGHNSILYAIADNPPNASIFIPGSLGSQAGTNFKLDKGDGFKGRDGRNPNGNDQKQNNLTKADANRTAYGIPKTIAGTNEKPNYVADIQVGIGMGALEALYPDVLKTLIEQQNAGKGSVWNGVAYLTGLNGAHDGSVTPELEALRSKIMNTQVGGSGKTIAQWAENPKDSRGNNWARTNHAQTGIKAYLQLEAAGVPSDVAMKIANNDDLVSGAGRIDQISPGRASNNQENTFTGMNNAERKQWEKAAQYARQLGKPEILRIMMDSHTMGSHMNTRYGNQGAESKINKNLGIDPNLPADQRKQLLVDYFMTHSSDPKVAGEGNGGGGGGGGNNGAEEAGRNITGATAEAQANAAAGAEAAGTPPAEAPPAGGAQAQEGAEAVGNKNPAGVPLSEAAGLAQFLETQEKLNEADKSLSLLDAKLAKALTDGRMDKTETKKLVKGITKGIKGNAKKDLVAAIKEASKDGKIDETEAKTIEKAADKAQDKTVKDALKDGKYDKKDQKALKEVLDKDQKAELKEANQDKKITKKELKDVLAADDKANKEADKGDKAGKDNKADKNDKAGDKGDKKDPKKSDKKDGGKAADKNDKAGDKKQDKAGGGNDKAGQNKENKKKAA